MVPYEGATEGVRIQNPGKPASKYADVDLSDNDDQWWRGRKCVGLAFTQMESCSSIQHMIDAPSLQQQAGIVSSLHHCRPQPQEHPKPLGTTCPWERPPSLNHQQFTSPFQSGHLPFPSLLLISSFFTQSHRPDQYLILDDSTLYFTVISFCTAQNQMKKQLSYVFEKKKSNEKNILYCT